MSLVPGQTWMPVPGTSRLRNALCAPTSSASIAAATTRATATRTSCPWITACRAFWGSAWTYPRTSKWTTTCGWSGRSSPSRFHGKNCYSENTQLSGRSSMTYWIDRWSMHYYNSNHSRSAPPEGAGKSPPDVDFGSLCHWVSLSDEHFSPPHLLIFNLKKS